MVQESKAARVAAVVWPWRVPRAPIPTASIRRASAMESAVMMGVAAVLWFGFRRPVLAGVAAGLGAVVFVGGQWVPPLYHAFKRLGSALAKGVGAALTWGLLVPFFYLCFPAGRFFFSMAGKDPLERRYWDKGRSYWIARPAVQDPSHYRRQY
jgi:hypothetical protein